MPHTSGWALIALGFIAMLSIGANGLPVPAPDDQWTEDGSGHFADDAVPFGQQPTMPTTTTSEPRPIVPVQRDLEDFVDLIPADEVRAKIAAYFKADADVQSALAFLNGKEFAALRQAFDLSAVQSMDHWLRKRGVNIKALAQRIDDVLGVSKLRVPPPTSTGGFGHSAMPTTTTIGGLNGMLEEIFALIPQDEIFILFFEKLDSSVAFAELVEKMGSAEFYAYYDSLKRSTDLRKMNAELSKHKIDIRKIVELFQSHFLFGAH